MTDIVKRLREAQFARVFDDAFMGRDPLPLDAAADEIERLRAVLRRIAHSADYDTIISPDGDRHQQAVEIALEALTEGGR